MFSIDRLDDKMSISNKKKALPASQNQKRTS